MAGEKTLPTQYMSIYKETYRAYICYTFSCFSKQHKGQDETTKIFKIICRKTGRKTFYICYNDYRKECFHKFSPFLNKDLLFENLYNSFFYFIKTLSQIFLKICESIVRNYSIIKILLYGVQFIINSLEILLRSFLEIMVERCEVYIFLGFWRKAL